MTLLERLKIETRLAHDRIERAVDLTGRVTSLSAYRALLARFYGFHCAWEAAAEPIIADRDFFRRRCKTHLLKKDLQALGLKEEEVAELPLCDPLMWMPTQPAAFGAMYVVEGSTLGGGVIAHHVERTLGLTAETGAAYFRSYGPETGAMWKAFRAKLAGLSSPRADELVIEAANQTFDVLHRWLSREAAA